ncbi:CPBP family intramembrane metalloprotease [Arenibacter sp. M-2]|uniref:CPBP family intramembrane glutamic endopeptidase n=1 Tax=Arenibacter sp. M-2 TaxID=3053612 RepID=UPI002570FA0D|nr:CPBP family intramembrane glutamic endopeptidase [Arenibacter sp. M-2]MDL5513038.1 CPBP family intramembrane metalloprotease [Arenibacter sp. M-2]
MKVVNPLQWKDYIFFCGLPTLLNYIACQLIIPLFETNSLLPIEVIYFISVGGIALIPMFIMSIFLSKNESTSNKIKAIFFRMRINKLSKKDWVYTIVTFIILCTSSYLTAKIIMPKMGIDAMPFFFKNMPLVSHNMWILYVWTLFFFFNILGEEFLWRGYILPRQELQLGKWAWFVQGIFWTFWHLPMGLDLILVSFPIFFILPAVAQLRQNTTIAILIHTVFGAFGFMALAFGFVN